MKDGVAWFVVTILVVILVLFAVYLLRIRYLLNLPASIQVTLRNTDGKWFNAIAVLNDDTLDIYLTRVPRWAPNRRWDRHTISFEVQRPRDGIQVATLVMPVDTCRVASSPEEMNALLSWIDSARPEAEPTIA